MNDWLPRVPLALVACARALLVPGEAGQACTQLMAWPRLSWTVRWRAPEPAPLRAPAQ